MGSFEEYQKQIKDEFLKREEELSKKLKAAKSFKIKVTNEPNEENLQKIIDFIKKVELFAGRVNDETGVIRRYTWMHCSEPAALILKVYNENEKLKIVRLSSRIPLVFGKTPAFHYAVEFEGCYYDINGKHTFNEMKDYCNKEFAWTGMEVDKFGKPEAYVAEPNDVLTKFCLSRISVIKKEVDEAKPSV